MNSSHCLQAISSAFPELEITQITPLGEGWANWSFECPEGLVFRFPKNVQSAAELDAITPLSMELNPQLSLPSPHYIHQGIWQGLPFVGYQKIPGVPLMAAQFKAHANRSELCAQLGKFLSELHTFPMETVREALPNSLQNPWLEECISIASLCREHLFPLLGEKISNRIQQEFDSFIASLEANPIEPVFVHGDLEPSHILYTEPKGPITGIIDFDDGGVGDPAWDIRLLLHYYGTDLTEEILAHYTASPVDDFFWRRIRFYERFGLFQDGLNALNNQSEQWLNSCLHSIAATFIMG